MKIKNFFLFIIISIFISCSSRIVNKESSLYNGYNPFTNQKIDSMSFVFHISAKSDHFNKTLYLKGNTYFKEGNLVLNIYSPLLTGLTSVYQVEDTIYLYENFNRALYVYSDYSKLSIMNISLSFFIECLNYLFIGNNSAITSNIKEPEFKLDYKDNFLHKIISPDYQIITFENYSLVSSRENIFFPSNIKIYDTFNEAMFEIELKNIRSGVYISDEKFVIPEI